jgi:hypothetical protein
VARAALRDGPVGATPPRICSNDPKKFTSVTGVGRNLSGEVRKTARKTANQSKKNRGEELSFFEVCE